LYSFLLFVFLFLGFLPKQVQAFPCHLFLRGMEK
jgi:hypothetical protein